MERYLPRATAADVAASAGRLAAAASDLRSEGRRVEWLRSLALPGDEAGLCSFRAESEADVEEANTRAGVAYERIVEVLQVENQKAVEL